MQRLERMTDRLLATLELQSQGNETVTDISEDELGRIYTELVDQGYAMPPQGRLPE